MSVHVAHRFNELLSQSVPRLGAQYVAAAGVHDTSKTRRHFKGLTSCNKYAYYVLGDLTRRWNGTLSSISGIDYVIVDVSHLLSIFIIY